MISNLHHTLCSSFCISQKGGAWIWLQRGGTGGGGIFSLSPPNANAVMSSTADEKDQIFPPGFVSLASGHYHYLTSTGFCVHSNSLGLNDRYTGGILCRSPLRVLKLWSTGLSQATAPPLFVEVWLNNTQPGVSEQSTRDPDITQLINYHAVADLSWGFKQGYSLPVFIDGSVSYRLSLGTEGEDVPGNWIIEFSDPVMGNRWDEEHMSLSVKGRVCENNGIISSQHSRRYMYGMGLQNNAWGNSGACVDSSPPKMSPVECGADAPGIGENNSIS